MTRDADLPGLPALPAPVRELFPFESKFLDLPDGNRMHYVDEGETDGEGADAGESIVFAHGNPTWSFLYRRFIDHYRDTHRAVAMDHIGFGLSTKPTDAAYYSIETHARNFGALMDHLDLRDVTLVIPDWGGPIAMGWAIEHRERIKRLVVLDTMLGVSRVRVSLPWWFMLMRKRPLGELLYGRLNLFVRGFVERMGTQRSLTEAERTAYRLPFRSAAERAGVVAFPRLIPQRPGDPTYDLLRRIEETVAEWELPALVVWADADAGFSAEMARQAVALLRQADGPHFVPASHYLQEDAPAEIMQQIDGFLTRNP